MTDQTKEPCPKCGAPAHMSTWSNWVLLYECNSYLQLYETAEPFVQSCRCADRERLKKDIDELAPYKQMWLALPHDEMQAYVQENHLGFGGDSCIALVLQDAIKLRGELAAAKSALLVSEQARRLAKDTNESPKLPTI